MLGILGGMGPLAGADFFRKVIERTPAGRDQDHLPTLVYSLPQIPDRTAALFEAGDDPFPALLRGMQILVDAGASCIAMPCNSAHFWWERLSERIEVPILHIVQAGIDGLRRRGMYQGRVGLLGTELTLRTELYRGRLRESGYEPVLPDDGARVMQAIRLIKAGQLERASQALKNEESWLLDRGCERVLLACTEIPLVLDPQHASPHSVDVTVELAIAAVQWCSGQAERCASPAA